MSVMKTLAEVELDMLQEESWKLDFLLKGAEAELMLEQQNVENQRIIKDELIKTVRVTVEHLSKIQEDLAVVQKKETQLKKSIDSEKINRAFTDDYVEQTKQKSAQLQKQYDEYEVDLEQMEGRYQRMKKMVCEDVDDLYKTSEGLKKAAEGIMEGLIQIQKGIEHMDL